MYRNWYGHRTASGEPPAKSMSFLRAAPGVRGGAPIALRSNRVSMSAVCPESERLLNADGAAVQEFMFQEQHFAALVERDEDATRYELLITWPEKGAARQVRLSTPCEEHDCEKTAREAIVD